MRLQGLLDRPEGARAVVLIVHGLGGDARRPYVRRAANAARAAGLASLRIALRGADGSGEDLYHAGLHSDLSAALASPELAGYGRRFVLGFSIGGHVALRLALDGAERPDAVATVCAPLDLEASQQRLDSGGGYALYRSWLLSGLRAHYRALEARDRAPAPWDEVAPIRTIRAWDDIVVARRFGFADAGAYYASVAVGARAGDLALPTLCVAARQDPLVDAADALEEAAEGNPALTVRVVERGGHVGFPRSLDLGFGPRRGLDAQVMAWFQSEARIPDSKSG